MKNEKGKEMQFWSTYGYIIKTAMQSINDTNPNNDLRPVSHQESICQIKPMKIRPFLFVVFDDESHGIPPLSTITTVYQNNATSII